jgi:outer membrane protein
VDRSDEETVPPERAREMGEEIRSWSEAFDTAPEISLADCFRLALSHSEELLIRGEKLFEAWTLEREAISSLLPAAYFNWAYSVDSDSIRFQNQTISPRDTTESWLTLQQTLFDGQSFAAVPAAREARKIERLRLKDERDRLLYAVAAAFYEILGFQEDVTVLEAVLESAEEFSRVVEARWKSGEASRQEVLAAKAQQDNASALLIQARHDVKIARTALARLVGLDEIPEELLDTYTVAFSPGNIPDLVERARVERPDVGAARASIDFAKAERLAALSDYFPRITADLTRWLKREGAFSDAVDWNLSLNLLWPIFDSGGREARQARALSGIRQRELELSALKRQVRQEVEEAVLSFESLGNRLGALKSRAEASKVALELVTAEYKAAEATNLDVITGRRTWAEAERDFARAQLARKLAALKIRLVLGDFKISEPFVEAMEIVKE